MEALLATVPHATRPAPRIRNRAIVPVTPLRARPGTLTATALAPKPILVINPYAGLHAGHSRAKIEAVRCAARTAGTLVEEHGVDAQRDALRDLTDHGSLSGRPRFFAILGGDGTIHTVLNDLVSIYGERNLPPILPLAGGTMNVLAQDLRFRGTPVEQFRRADEILSRPPPAPFVERALLRVDFDPTGETRYGFIFANGALYDLISVYERDASKLGMLRLMSRLVFSSGFRKAAAPRYPMSIHLPDGIQREGLHFAVLASSLQRFMFGIRPFDGEHRSGRDYSFLATRDSAGTMTRRGLRYLWRPFRRAFPISPETSLNITLHEPVGISGHSGVTIDGDRVRIDANSVTLSSPVTLRIPDLSARA